MSLQDQAEFVDCFGALEPTVSPPVFGGVELMNPYYATREACKQMLQLEQHLKQPHRNCDDCIRKHFLSTEAHLEEALDLEPDDELYQMLSGVLPKIRQLAGRYDEGEDLKTVGKALRQVRKPLVPVCFSAMGT